MPERMLLRHGISIKDMVALIRAGYATATGECVRAGDRLIELARLTITDGGRIKKNSPQPGGLLFLTLRGDGGEGLGEGLFEGRSSP